MSSQQIQTLLAPPSDGEAQHKAAVFINSRFQSFDHLDNLASLVVEAKQHNDELQANLSLSQSKVDILLAKTRTSAEIHLKSAQELSLVRHSLADELLDLSQELVSTISDGGKPTTLLEDIETLHRSLKELQIIKRYVQIIEHALKLSELSLLQIRATTSSVSLASLSDYQALQDFVSKVSEACSTVEDGSGQQSLHVVMFLEKLHDKTWADIKSAFSSLLSDAAEKIGWPMPVDYPAASAEDRRAFEDAFSNLLKLQAIGEKIKLPATTPRLEKEGLYAIQALVHPISLRFKYHFEGSRQTNRLDKPEWYFTHILNASHEHRLFMDAVVQKLLVSSEYRGINAWREFTLLLLPILSRKLKHTTPSLLPHPPLLAHTIYQALTFDATIAEEGFQLQATSAARGDHEGEWQGVSEVILGNIEWFESWLNGERKFVEDQYHEIISTLDAWVIADDDGSSENSSDRDFKSTNSSRKIKALLEQVTDRYSPLPHINQRTRFLSSVQLPLLNLYHGRISASLDAFETLSSAFVRAVPGALNVSLAGKEEGGLHVDTSKLTGGVEGVQRLCKALLSAKYIEVSMEGWGEELFFLELWAQITQDPFLRARAVDNPLLPNPTTQKGELPRNTLFEELISQYRNIVRRAEDMIMQQLCGEVESALKAHFSMVTSTSPDQSVEQTDDITLSRTLLPPIALLSSHLTFIRAILPWTTVTTVYRRVASRLAEHILQRQILYRGHFDLREGKSILAECKLWIETCHVALAGSLSGGQERIEAPWAKLLQAGKLASAEGDMWNALLGVVFGTQSGEDWEVGMTQIVGSVELGRDEVARVLKRRVDCDH
ncbi:hypothetical protein L208DRAFT_1425343 [Tricholoma matsutake]|nr:hypothetical protein L208DRAFT_1425343 [Tricholoma matsutake 945]